MSQKEILFDSNLLYESLLFRIDFSDWPNGISLYFWNNGCSYRLDLKALLKFHYETRNIGEFTEHWVECYFVGFVEDHIQEHWKERVRRSGLVSRLFGDVCHLIVGSNMLAIESIHDRSIGMSVVCREYSFFEVYDVAPVSATS